MQDLLQSVSQRYKSGMNFHNLFTLSHRIRRQTAKFKFETTDLERGILRTVNSDMLRHVEQWKQQTARMEKQRLETDKRVKRQNDLIFTNISIRMKRLERELAALKALENERREEGGLTKEAAASAASRSAKYFFDEQADASNTKMHSEIRSITKRAVRSALQKMREEQDYERRRG